MHVSPLLSSYTLCCVQTGFCGRFGHRKECQCHLKHRRVAVDDQVPAESSKSEAAGAAGHPASEWQAFGHTWVGRRVRRFFGNTPVDGQVTAYMPPGYGEDEPALWHLVHDDGDEEDLEERDVRDAMAIFNLAHRSQYVPNLTGMGAHSYEAEASLLALQNAFGPYNPLLSGFNLDPYSPLPYLTVVPGMNPALSLHYNGMASTRLLDPLNYEGVMAGQVAPISRVRDEDPHAHYMDGMPSKKPKVTPQAEGDKGTVHDQGPGANLTGKLSKEMTENNDMPNTTDEAAANTSAACNRSIAEFWAAHLDSF